MAHEQPAVLRAGGRGDARDEPLGIDTLLEALPCGALLVNRAGTIVRANARLCEMMQRPRESVIGLSLVDLYPSGPGRQVVDYALDHFETPREQEFFLPLPNGTEVPVIVSARFVRGEPPLGDHRLLTVTDISQQKRGEKDLQQRYNDIASLSDTVLEQALQLKRYSKELEQRVRERTLDLHTANMEAIYMLAVASEAKDHDTGAHVRRIERYTRLLASELGQSAAEAERMGYSAILHDVGKIHVPDDILRKPGPLTPDEWKIMREHVIMGERILSREPFFELARTIARSHHENWDGSGYPDGMSGTSIPLAARIVRVADVFDALTFARPYKRAWSVEEAATTVEREQGQAFDPAVVKAFLAVFRSGRMTPAEAP